MAGVVHLWTGRRGSVWTYTTSALVQGALGVTTITADTFQELMDKIRVLAVARESVRDFEESMRKVEATMAIDFNWWNVRLDMLPRETSASPADLASDALSALEDASLVPYLRGAAVAMIDGALDVRCDVVARSAGSAVNIVEQTVNLRVGARTYKGGARRTRP